MTKPVYTEQEKIWDGTLSLKSFTEMVTKFAAQFNVSPDEVHIVIESPFDSDGNYMYLHRAETPEEELRRLKREAKELEKNKKAKLQKQQKELELYEKLKAKFEKKNDSNKD